MDEQIPLWPKSGSADAPWIPSPMEAVLHAISIGEVGEETKFADIGCGDGRAAVIAAKYAKSTAACIEIREELCMLSEANAIYNGVSDRFRVICSDARKVDYNEFDVIYIYMFPSFIEEISRKLDEELRMGSRVITLDFPIKGWEPVLIRRFIDGRGIRRTLFMYVVGLSNPSSWRYGRFDGYPEQ